MHDPGALRCLTLGRVNKVNQKHIICPDVEIRWPFVAHAVLEKQNSNHGNKQQVNADVSVEAICSVQVFTTVVY